MNDKRHLIIADTLKREDIFHHLLHEKTGLIDVEVLPLSVFLDGNNHVDKTLNTINCYQVLQANKDHYQILANAMTYPSFIDEVLSFIYNITEYGINIDQLPNNTSLEKEINDVCQLFDAQLLGYQSQKDKINQLVLYDNVYFYPTYFNNIAEKEAYHLLRTKGVKDYPLTPSKSTTIKLYRSLNKRQEIESVAQYLIKQAIPLNDIIIVLANPGEYYHWLKAIFNRYHIPFATTITDEVLPLIQRYQKLINLIKDPHTNHLIDCLNNHCFNDDFHQLATYLKQYNIPFSDCLNDLTNLNSFDEQILVSGNDLYHAKTIKELAIKQHQVILPLLNKINTCEHNLLSIATLAYDIIKIQHDDQLSKDQLYLLKDFLESYLPKINDQQLFDYLLTKLRLKPKLDTINQLLVINLDEAVGLKRKQMILLGADSVAYPKINYHTGIMDEKYYNKLNYPLKDERYRFALDQLEHCFNYCEQLIISYAYGDFAGKIKKISFELEEYLKKHINVKFIDWPLAENDDLPYVVHSLNPKLSKQLFFDDNLLTGSVSSFERYFNCPYQYFIQSGLKKQTIDLSINSAKLGIILHYVLQKLVSDYHHDYTKASDNTIQMIVDETFTQLLQIYPYHLELIQVLKLSFTDMIKRYLKDLKKLEDNTEFKPLMVEHRFQEEINLDDITIKLNGIIDRVDTTKDAYRIIDYKSSTHTLNEKKVTNGQQLQLLTYLWLIEEKLSLQPEGAYYLSFNNNKTPVESMKFDRRKHQLSVFDPTDWYLAYLKKHQLSGWNFMPKDDTKKKTKNIETYKDILKANYQQLATELLNGVIAPSPQKDACKYCAFLGICRYYQNTDDEQESDGDDDALE